jgi:hypothetical protein
VGVGCVVFGLERGFTVVSSVCRAAGDALSGGDCVAVAVRVAHGASASGCSWRIGSDAIFGGIAFELGGG